MKWKEKKGKCWSKIKVLKLLFKGNIKKKSYFYLESRKLIEIEISLRKLTINWIDWKKNFVRLYFYIYKKHEKVENEDICLNFFKVTWKLRF